MTDTSMSDTQPKTNPRMTSPNTILSSLAGRSDERVGLDGIWRIIRRRMALIVCVTAAIVTATYVIVSTMEPEYKTRSTVVLTTLDTRVRSSDVQLETFELSRATIETELNILRSREFAYQVLDTLQPHDNPAFMDTDTADVLEGEASLRERMIDKMLSSYSVFREGESLAVQIVATASDAALAADIANAVAETYIAQNVQKRRQAISSSITFLRERVQMLGEELSAAELALASFIRENELDDMDLPIQLRGDVDRLTAIVAARGDSADEDGAGARAAAQLEQTQAALHARTRAELSLLSQERAMELLRVRYQSSIERLNDLETQIDFIVQGDRQVSFARIPSQAASPNAPVALAASVLAGLVLSFVAALALESVNTRLWNEDQTSAVSGLPNFGYTPRIFKHEYVGNLYKPSMFMLSHPYSAFTEALRGFLTIWFNMIEKSRIVMVTSGLPNEGKSTVAVALATAAAQDGMRVLLLDLDFHRQGAAALLEVSRSKSSLEDVLDGAKLPDVVVLDEAENVSLEFLSIKMRNKTPPNVFKAQLSELRTHLNEAYDLVLVDTPPVLILDEACRLNSLVDNSILVVRWGKTTQDVLRDACERLQRNSVPVAGTIINDVDLSKHRTYGYGGYAHYYGDDAYQRG
ncbi:AAA family ATPase [uncultured Tateyamaria sp.]|uniref:GumC family protein n=1 Tax=uncultured Tateyamaria sp. TaxID=455651 RepID=UPI002635B27E|nr:AAA family ATPase [uncultured Tateyamaria sp.]